MRCSQCGKENPKDALLCISCGSALPPAPAQSEAVRVKTSRLALAAFVLGIFSLLFLPIALSPLGRLIFSIAGLGTADLAVFFGVISLVQISLSHGKLVGKAFAVIGTVIPIVVLSIVIFVLIGARRSQAQLQARIRCGTNLSTIGKAMALYATDHDDMFPHAGGKDTIWRPSINNWHAKNRQQAFGLSGDDGSGGQASISSSLYLLVKYCEFPPKSLGPPELFVCPGDRGTTVFNPARYRITDRYLIQLWDFGPNPARHCGYAYHLPYGPYPLDASCDGDLPVAADRNPFMASPGTKPVSVTDFDPSGTEEQQKNGNSPSHEKEGQNILFMDMHVSFESGCLFGPEDDNIYTSWDDRDKVRGVPPTLDSQPADRLDSLLVHDPPVATHK